MNKQNKADILIRGWDVPKGCDSCQLNANGRGCTITGTQYEGDTWVMMDFDEHAERLPDCPLVELPPHGNLIERVQTLRAINNCDIPDGVSEHDFYEVIASVHEALEKVPVIVPANKEKTE